jgi:hypothetical protein
LMDNAPRGTAVRLGEVCAVNALQFECQPCTVKITGAIEPETCLRVASR